MRTDGAPSTAGMTGVRYELPHLSEVRYVELRFSVENSDHRKHNLDNLERSLPHSYPCSIGPPRVRQRGRTLEHIIGRRVDDLDLLIAPPSTMAIR